MEKLKEYEEIFSFFDKYVFQHLELEYKCRFLGQLNLKESFLLHFVDELYVLIYGYIFRDGGGSITSLELGQVSTNTLTILEQKYSETMFGLSKF